MKRFLVLLILLLAVPSYAQQCSEDTQLARLTTDKIGGSVPATPAGGPDTYYYSFGGLVPSGGGLEVTSTDQAWGDNITCTVGGNITYIGVYVGAKGGSDLSLMLLDPSNVLSECGSIANASITENAWNDIPVSPVLAVNSSDVVKVFVGVSLNSHITVYSLGSGDASGGFYDGDHEYDTYCGGAPSTPNATDWTIAVRVYVD